MPMLFSKSLAAKASATQGLGFPGDCANSGRFRAPIVKQLNRDIFHDMKDSPAVDRSRIRKNSGPTARILANSATSKQLPRDLRNGHLVGFRTKPQDDAEAVIVVACLHAVVAAQSTAAKVCSRAPASATQDTILTYFAQG